MSYSKDYAVETLQKELERFNKLRQGALNMKNKEYYNKVKNKRQNLIDALTLLSNDNVEGNDVIEQAFKHIPVESEERVKKLIEDFEENYKNNNDENTKK